MFITNEHLCQGQSMFLFHFGPLVPFCVCHIFISVPCAHVMIFCHGNGLPCAPVSCSVAIVFKLCFIMLVVLCCLYFECGAVVFFCSDSPCSGLSLVFVL